MPDALARRELTTHAFPSEQNFRAEPAGLVAGAFGKLRARDPVWKAKVVLDLRTAARLAANRPALDHHGLESLGRAIHRGAQPGRSGAINREVVLGS